MLGTFSSKQTNKQTQERWWFRLQALMTFTAITSEDKTSSIFVGKIFETSDAGVTYHVWSWYQVTLPWQRTQILSCLPPAWQGHYHYKSSHIHQVKMKVSLETLTDWFGFLHSSVEWPREPRGFWHLIDLFVSLQECYLICEDYAKD